MGPGAGQPGSGQPGAGRSSAAGHGRLLGHLALANPQWQSVAAGSSALAIVHGPQAYVSPAWYPSKARHGRVVPTLNYVTVHFTGTLTVHRDPGWLRDVVTRLTERHEAGRPHPWAVSDAPPDYLEGQLRGIVGVELDIATVEAKHKLSQNRGADDRAAVIAALRGEPGGGAAQIAGLMSASRSAGRSPAGRLTSDRGPGPGSAGHTGPRWRPAARR